VAVSAELFGAALSATKSLVRNREPRAPDVVRRLIVGGISGAAATLPMSVAMLAMHFGIPGQQNFLLPPHEIMKKLLVVVRPPGYPRTWSDLGYTTLNHFGYGSFAGTPFGFVYGRTAGESTARGVGYGLAVFVFGYLGWLPVMRILHPAREYPPARLATIIVSHVVWGASLGWTAHGLATGSD
jgi:uncharacterized membrane protein YagU involved in acid resistance